MEYNFQAFTTTGRPTPMAIETERELQERFNAIRERADALRRHL